MTPEEQALINVQEIIDFMEVRRASMKEINGDAENTIDECITLFKGILQEKENWIDDDF